MRSVIPFLMTALLALGGNAAAQPPATGLCAPAGGR